MCDWGPLLVSIPYFAICFFALLFGVIAYVVSPHQPVVISGSVPFAGKSFRIDAGGAIAAFLGTFLLLTFAAPKELYEFKEFCSLEKAVTLWSISVPLQIYKHDGSPVNGYDLAKDAKILLEPKNHELLPDETLTLKKFPLTDEDVRTRKFPIVHVLLLNDQPYSGGVLKLEKAALEKIDYKNKRIQFAQPILIQLLPKGSNWQKREFANPKTSQGFKDRPQPFLSPPQE